MPFAFVNVPPKGFAPIVKVLDKGTREVGEQQATLPNLPQEKL